MMITEFGAFPASYFERTESEQIDHLITFFAPPLMKFAASWEWQTTRLWQRPYFLTYSELFSNPEKTLSDIAVHLDCKVMPERRSIAANRRDGVRFNVGQGGRGRQKMSDLQIARLEDMARGLGCPIIFV